MCVMLRFFFCKTKRTCLPNILRVVCSQTMRMEKWHSVIQRAWCCSLQSCSDRLHMPGNLEFISPPFLISAPVIQINSNEISRGKAPFGWGVLQLPTAKSNPMAFSSSEGRTNQPPPTSIKAPLLSAYESMNRRRCHSQKLSLYPEKSLNSSHGLRGFSLNS